MSNENLNHKSADKPPSTHSDNNEKLDKWLDNAGYLTYLTDEENELLRRQYGIVIGDFLNITCQTGGRSWLTDDAINTSFALLTKLKKRTDCFFLPTFDAHQLCQIGLGKLKIGADLELLREGLLDDKKRWIIVACNDGMMKVHEDQNGATEKNKQQATEPKAGPPDAATEEPAPAAQDGSVSKQPELEANPDTTMPNFTEKVPETDAANSASHAAPVQKPYTGKDATAIAGVHWGLMIIDTKKNVARWLDGLVELQPQVSNGKNVTKIKSMLSAATAAGKVLCGYDKLVRQERGTFTAGTLKWVPQQHKDNQSRPDEGACGPHMYACLKHVYAHPGALEDLHEHFRRKSRRPGNFKRGKSGFNSEHIRKEMQDLILHEKERNEKDSELWLALNAEIMRILSMKIIPEQLTQQIDKFKKLGQGSKQSSGKSGPPGDGNDDDDDGDDDDDNDPESKYLRDLYEEANENGTCAANGITSFQGFKVFIAKQKSLEDAANKKVPSEFGQMHTKNATILYLPKFHKDNLPNFATLANPECNRWISLYKDDLFEPEGRRGLHYQEAKAVLHRTYKGSFKGESDESLWLYVQHCSAAFSQHEKSNLSLEAIAERLDEVFYKLETPLFAALNEDQIKNWTKWLSPVMIAPMNSADGTFSNVLARGMLHRMFVGEFDDMSETELTEWRMTDPCLAGDYRKDNDTALLYMNTFYGAVDAVKIPWLKESPLHWPAREHRLLHGETNKRKRDAADGGTRDDGEDDENEDPKRPKHDRPGDEASTPSVLPAASGVPGSMQTPQLSIDPNELNWAAISEADLKTHITDAVRQDDRIKRKPNSYTYRALLFLLNGGTFKDETQTDNASLWARDTNVFNHGLHTETPGVDLVLPSDGKIDVRLDASEILRRMASQYEPTDALSLDVDWDAFKAHSIDFTHMKIAHLDEWVKREPPCGLSTNLASFGPWMKRAVLQKIFGGFELLREADRKHWHTRDTYFRKVKGGKKNVVAELEKRTADVPAADYRGRSVFIPNYFMKDFVEKVQEKRQVPKKTTKAQNVVPDALDENDFIVVDDE